MAFFIKWFHYDKLTYFLQLPKLLALQNADFSLTPEDYLDCGVFTHGVVFGSLHLCHQKKVFLSQIERAHYSVNALDKHSY